MQEFEGAYHHYTYAVRKKRLVLLVMLEKPLTNICDNNGGTNESTINFESLRQYLRSYTYIDYNASDWFVRLLYALPANRISEQQQRQQQQERHQADEQEPGSSVHDVDAVDALLLQ
jgi:hypothetical protein